MAIAYVQAGYVVPDLAAGIDQWRRTTGIGPWFVMRDIVPEDGLYRGRPATLSMSVAMAQSADIQIELVEQHDNGPSPYRDAFASGTGGFHHLCHWADRLDVEIERYRGLGAEPAYVASAGALRFAYIDTRALLGGFTEILEHEPGTVALFQRIAAAADGWDGQNPVRHVA